MDRVHFRINGKEYEAEPGRTVLDVVRREGIFIPTLCYNEFLSPYGACRLCIVEAETGGRRRLTASCCHPVEEGASYETDSAKVLEGRRIVVELLLARSPNSKEIRELAERFGVKRARFRLPEDDCILCGQCIRMCSEVAGLDAINFTGRGIYRAVETPFDMQSATCIACARCLYVCPTRSIDVKKIDRKEAYLHLFETESEKRTCQVCREAIVHEETVRDLSLLFERRGG